MVYDRCMNQTTTLDRLRTGSLVSTNCPECDEYLVGKPGAVGCCSYCGEWLDMPEGEQP